MANLLRAKGRRLRIAVEGLMQKPKRYKLNRDEAQESQMRDAGILASTETLRPDHARHGDIITTESFMLRGNQLQQFCKASMHTALEFDDVRSLVDCSWRESCRPH